MVVSVFATTLAFAGGAAALTGTPAAAGNTVVTDVSTTGVQANHALNVTVESGDSIATNDITSIEVDYAAFGTTGTDTLSSVISNDDASVLVNGNTVTVNSVSQLNDDDAATIDITGTTVEAGDTVEVQLTGVDNPSSAESADVSVTLDDGSTSVSQGLALETTQPNVLVAPERGVATIGSGVEYTATVTDSNGDPIQGVDVVVDESGTDNLATSSGQASTDLSTTINTDANGEASVTLYNTTSAGVGSYDATFTEQLSTGGNQTTITHSATVQDTVYIDGEISDDKLRPIQDDGNVTINVTSTDGNYPSYIVEEVKLKNLDTLAASNPYVESAGFYPSSGSQVGEYYIELEAFSDDTEYTFEADFTGFQAFDGDVVVSPGQQGDRNIRLTRIVEADKISVTSPANDPVDVDPITGNQDIEVLVESYDYESPFDDLSAWPGEGVDVTVENVDDPNGVLAGDGTDIVFDPASQSNTTVSDGTTQFNVALDLGGVTVETLDEDITVELAFTPANAANSTVTTTQNVTFVAEPPSGEGTISGTVDEINEDIQLGSESLTSSRAEGVNVHAVQSDRLQENDISLNVEQDDTDYVRVGADTDGDDTAEEWLDVQTDYLFTSSEAEVVQNLSIAGSGFSAADTDSSGPDSFTVSVLEAGDYVVQVSEDGDFSSPELDTTFTAANNLTYEDTKERYGGLGGVPAVQTDVTGEDGTFKLLNLYTNGEVGLEYTVIAGDGNGDLGFANALGYEQVSVLQNAEDEVTVTADSTDEQLDVSLSVQQVDITADSVNATNRGTVPSADDADADYGTALNEFGNTSDDFRQEIPRDNSTVDVIHLRTFLSEGDMPTEGANVTVSYTAEGTFDGEFLSTVVGGDEISNSTGQIQIDTSSETDGMADGEAVLFLQTDKAGFGTDVNVTIDVTMNNAAGSDSMDKEFVGVLDQAYESGSITGVVSDDNDNPVDARIYVSEMVDPGNNIEITFTPDDVNNLTDFTATVYDTDGSSDTVIETVNLTDDEMRNFEFQGFSSNLSLESGEEPYTLLADRQADRTTLSPVPALEVSDIDNRVRFALTGVSETGATGTSVSTGVQVNRTSTASIVIDEAAAASFQVSDLSPTDYTAGADETFTVSATIENIGDITAAKDVELRLNGSTVDTESVELDAGNSTTVEFDVNASNVDAGDYIHSVWTMDDEASGNLTVEEAATGNWYDAYVDQNGVVDEPGLNAAVSDYLGDELSDDERFNAVVSSYISGDPIADVIDN